MFPNCGKRRERIRYEGRGMRRGYRFTVPASIIVLALVSCLLATSAGAAVKIEKINYKGWAGSYRMTNGTVDVVVVPAVARIMRYGFVGGPNLLWENEKALGKPAKPGDWPNFGGDKAWPWPQDDWPKRTGGSGWPPPPATDQVAHIARLVGRDTVRLTSPVVAGYGIRIVRDITLNPTGTQVRIRTRFDKVRGSGGSSALPMGVWV